jgi:hypothetical protein
MSAGDFTYSHSLTLPADPGPADGRARESPRTRVRVTTRVVRALALLALAATVLCVAPMVDSGGVSVPASSIASMVLRCGALAFVIALCAGPTVRGGRAPWVVATASAVLAAFTMILVAVASYHPPQPMASIPRAIASHLAPSDRARSAPPALSSWFWVGAALAAAGAMLAADTSARRLAIIVACGAGTGAAWVLVITPTLAGR